MKENMNMIAQKTKWLIGLTGFLGFAGASFAAEASEQTELYVAARIQQRKPALVMVSTIDAENFPQTRAMSNLRFEEHATAKPTGENDFTAYAVTRTDSEKLKHLTKNPHMSMYYQSGGQGLLLMGRGEIVMDPVMRRAVWNEGFKQMGYANADDPMLTVLRFTPTHGKFYYKQKQHKLTFSQRK